MNMYMSPYFVRSTILVRMVDTCRYEVAGVAKYDQSRLWSYENDKVDVLFANSDEAILRFL